MQKGLKVNSEEYRCKVDSESRKVEVVAVLCGEVYALSVAETVKTCEDQQLRPRREKSWLS